MNRIGTITIACAALLLTATATSLSWQVGTRLTIVTSDGARIIGVGEIVDFDLRLSLAKGYNGLAVLMVEGPAGTLETFDVVVEEGGTVLLGEGGDYSDLGKAAEDSGLAYRVLFEDGGDEEADRATPERPASISPTEWAEFVERERAGEEQRVSDLELLGAGAGGREGSEATDEHRLDALPPDDTRSRDAPRRGRRGSDPHRQDAPGRSVDGNSGWGPGRN